MQNKKPNNSLFILPPPTAEELGVIPASKGSLTFKIYRSVFLFLMIVGIASGVGFYGWLNSLGVFSTDVDSLAKTVAKRQTENTVVYDRSGARIGELFDKYQIYIPYDEIPKGMINAILAIEDRAFFSHKGIDLKAILRAAKASMLDREYSQGASTITQQVVRNLFLSREKSLERKVKEVAMSIRVERILSKQKILELYANSLFLGFGAYGVGAASARYFGKPLNKLETHEFALIAGLFQSPSNFNPHRYPERAKKRQKQVLTAMYHSKMLTREETMTLMKRELVYAPYKTLNEQIAPYFIDYVREQADAILTTKLENTGLRIYTTLDSNLQKKADEAFLNSQDVFSDAESLIIPDYKKLARGAKPRIEAGLLSTDPKTGEILAMIGGRDYLVSKYNRTYQALRSPGSSFKPVVYSLALTRGRKWSDVLLVSPVAVEGYRPKNYKEEYLSETTMLRAFYQSLNTAAVEIGSAYPVQDLLDQAAKLGVRTPLKLETGVILGASEVSMLDMARMYGAFANNGALVEPVAITKIVDKNGKVIYEAPPIAQRSTQVISPSVSYLMTEGLRSVVQYGTGTRVRHLSGIAVGKTGTSNDSVDNWFCGYTPNLVAITWVGNDIQLALAGKATGGTLALPIWDRYMSAAVSSRPKSFFQRPAGISSAFIDPKYGYQSSDGIKMYSLSTQRPAEASSDYKEIDEKGSFRTLYGH